MGIGRYWGLHLELAMWPKPHLVQQYGAMLHILLTGMAVHVCRSDLVHNLATWAILVGLPSGYEKATWRGNLERHSGIDTCQVGSMCML